MWNFTSICELGWLMNHRDYRLNISSMRLNGHFVLNFFIPKMLFPLSAWNRNDRISLSIHSYHWNLPEEDDCPHYLRKHHMWSAFESSDTYPLLLLWRKRLVSLLSHYDSALFSPSNHNSFLPSKIPYFVLRQGRLYRGKEMVLSSSYQERQRKNARLHLWRRRKISKVQKLSLLRLCDPFKHGFSLTQGNPQEHDHLHRPVRLHGVLDLPHQLPHEIRWRQLLL